MKILAYYTERDKNGWECGGGSYIQYKGARRMIQGNLRMDYNKTGDGILWMMQRPILILGEYGSRERLEKKLYDEADVLEDGETVRIVIIARNESGDLHQVSDKQYKFKALGDHSDCGLFEEV